MSTAEEKEQFETRMKLASQSQSQLIPSEVKSEIVSVQSEAKEKRKLKPGRRRARGRPKKKLSSYDKIRKEKKIYADN